MMSSTFLRGAQEAISIGVVTKCKQKVLADVNCWCTGFQPNVVNLRSIYLKISALQT